MVFDNLDTLNLLVETITQNSFHQLDFKDSFEKRKFSQEKDFLNMFDMDLFYIKKYFDEYLQDEVYIGFVQDEDCNWIGSVFFKNETILFYDEETKNRVTAKITTKANSLEKVWLILILKVLVYLKKE